MGSERGKCLSEVTHPGSDAHSHFGASLPRRTQCSSQDLPFQGSSSPEIANSCVGFVGKCVYLAHELLTVAARAGPFPGNVFAP